ncbi:MAG: glycerol-3-phosphate acyltransferase [Chloroflexi bacterium]|nr:glycerol-3-phosphate acyltransferase [Chloroflexota bacterium]
MISEIALTAGSYLLGSLPIVYLMGRRRGLDLRRAGSGNVGGGNLWQVAGASWGILGGLADVAKGALPVGIGKALGFDLPWIVAAGLAGVVGQMWPFFLKFSGGRGNAPGIGFAATLGLWQALMVIPIMLLGGVLWGAPHILGSNLPWKQRLAFHRSQSRAVPMFMLLGFAVVPLFTWSLDRGFGVTLSCLGLLALILMRRLTAGWRQDSKGNLASRLWRRLIYDRAT